MKGGGDIVSRSWDVVVMCVCPRLMMRRVVLVGFHDHFPDEDEGERRRG